MKTSPWLVTISRIPPEGLELKLSLDEEWFARWLAQDPGLEIAGPARGEARVSLSRHGRDLLMRGRVAGTLTLACSRCLTPFETPLTATFELLLTPGPEPVRGGEEPLTQEELDLDFFTGDTLDLEPYLKEQVVLMLPVKPLCSESCRGLCPRCGADLNLGPCACQGEPSGRPGTS